MNGKKYHSILVLLLIVVLCASLGNIQSVHADDETPTEPPVPTQVETEVPTEPVMVETALPTEPATVATQLPTETPIAEMPLPDEPPVTSEEVTEPLIAEVLSQVPENTEVVVLDENGDAIPLATQETAEIIEMTDPMWCPVGVLPGDSRCSSKFGSINQLISDM